MDTYSDWGSALGSALVSLLNRTINYLPSLLGAFALLVIGWFVARILKTVAVRLIRLLDRALHRVVRGRHVAAPSVPSASAEVLGSIVFWLVILFFVTAATQVLGLDAFSVWLNRVVAYMPTLVAGGLIVLAGFLVSTLARDIVVTAGAPASPQQRALLGRIVQTMILITAMVIGADQIGIDVTFLVILSAIVTGTLLGGIALAVSLGSRGLVSNLFGAHHARQVYRVGQRIRIDRYEGKILDLTSTSVVLETQDGRVTLPAKLFSEAASVLLVRSDTDG